MTSHGSVAPVTGAADAGRGVAASGMCPSPANSPEVGSSPTQPAPGRKTSHQACRSVKSAVGPDGPSSGFVVGDELHEVARHEPGGEAEVAQDLHQQPAAVAARAERLAQGDVRVLHARLHAGRVGDVALEPLVEADQEVDRRACPRAAWRPRRASAAAAGRRGRTRGRAEVAEQLGVVGERDRLGLGLEEEVERVDDREVGDEVDHDRQLGGLLGEHEAGLEVAERVLLPVHEVVARLDGHRVGEDRGAAVRRGPQSDHVRREADGAIEQVAGAVLERDVDAHGEAASVPVPGK